MAKPLEESKQAATTLGAAIKGEKLLTQARKYICQRVTTGSSTHQIQRYDLETNAYAVIAKSLRWLAAPKSNPSSSSGEPTSPTDI